MSAPTLKDLEKALELHRQEDVKFHADMMSSYSRLEDAQMKQIQAMEAFTKANAPIADMYRTAGSLKRFALQTLAVAGSLVILTLGVIQLFKEWIHR